MAVAHDRASEALAPASGSTSGGGRDPLSDVLATVKLTGALYFLIEASEPWGVVVPRTEVYAGHVLPGSQHVISYDIILEGVGWVEFDDAPSVRFEAGDVLVFAHSLPHRLVSAPGVAPEFDAEATVAFLREMAAGRQPFATSEGGGGPARTRFVCGYLGCDVRPFNPVLAALPPFLKVARPPDGREDLLERLVSLTLDETLRARPGGEIVRLRLSELLFVEAIRRHLAGFEPAQRGWLAGLRDPGVGRALRLIHARPAEDWTLERLAHEAGMSRAVLAERFSHLVGRPPMQYLALWRMQVAGRMLADGEAKVAAVADAVGYGSEAAFSRAFKRAAGVAPAEWRERAR